MVSSIFTAASSGLDIRVTLRVHPHRKPACRGVDDVLDVGVRLTLQPGSEQLSQPADE